MEFGKGSIFEIVASAGRAMLQMEFEVVVSNRPILMSGNIQLPHTHLNLGKVASCIPRLSGSLCYGSQTCPELIISHLKNP